MKGDEAVVACQQLYKRYATGGEDIEVLKGVELALHPAEVVAILGPSGSGKSTLLHLLAGLDRPSSGEIFWQGHAIQAERQDILAQRRNRYLGLIFQSHYLLEDINVVENVALTGRIQGHVDYERVYELLEHVGLLARATFLPQTLSGGEKQRVAVARALYHRPKVILADEPTGSLDRLSAKVVYALLVDLAKAQDTAVLMVTHDEGLVEQVDARYRLFDGKLQQL